MYTAVAVVRDYDASTDSCSVELHELGVIDTWISGITIHAGVPRQQLVNGAQVAIATPDANRLCEAQVVSLAPQGSPATYAGGVLQRTENGRALVTTDGVGHGTLVVVFSPAFSATPQVGVQGDYFTGASVTAVSATQFTVSVTNPSYPNSIVSVTWTATGNA